MKPSHLEKSINNIISIARLAPSVHNTQPWIVNIEDDELVISLKPERLLVYGDPTGRQSWISLGIFVESCVVALSAEGFKAINVINQNEKVHIKTKPISGKIASDDISALKSRFTDRSIYKAIDIKEKQINEIVKAWHSSSVEVRVVRDREIINKCATLTQQGLMLAMSSPDFSKELSDYIVPTSSTPYGIPITTLKSGKIVSRFTKQLIAKGARRQKEANQEYNRWSSASAIVFILASGDTKPYWLEAGRSYLRTSLAIEKLGLRQATSAAIVEASDFHEDIEKMLQSKKRILCMLRVGVSDTKKIYSGRYEVKDLLT